jgi:hypothetical protein
MPYLPGFRTLFSSLTTLLAFLLLGALPCMAQVKVTADPAQNGNQAYSVSVSATPKSIYSTNASGCTSGYNYELVYDYAVTFSGVRPAHLFNLQVSFENTMNSGRFNNIALPTAGGTGTATTSRNQYRNTCDYATATTTSFGTKVASIVISGPGISERTVAYSATPLPVSLVSLNGTTWSAAYRVAGAGSTSQPRTYEQFDRTTATGYLYYRLKQVDQDGQATYSPMATVKAGPSLTEIQLYPNPNTTNAFTVAGLNGTGPWPLELRNALGNVVYEATATTGQVALPVLPAGVYFLRLQEAPGGRWVTTKYIKQ